MLLDQTHLYSLHVVIVMLTVLLPYYKCFVLDIAVLEVGLAKRVFFCLEGDVICQAFAFVFEVSTDLNRRLKFTSCLLKFILLIRES